MGVYERATSGTFVRRARRRVGDHRRPCRSVAVRALEMAGHLDRRSGDGCVDAPHRLDTMSSTRLVDVDRAARTPDRVGVGQRRCKGRAARPPRSSSRCGDVGAVLRAVLRRASARRAGDLVGPRNGRRSCVARWVRPVGGGVRSTGGGRDDDSPPPRALRFSGVPRGGVLLARPGRARCRLRSLAGPTMAMDRSGVGGPRRYCPRGFGNASCVAGGHHQRGGRGDRGPAGGAQQRVVRRGVAGRGPGDRATTWRREHSARAQRVAIRRVGRGDARSRAASPPRCGARGLSDRLCRGCRRQL